MSRTSAKPGGDPGADAEPRGRLIAVIVTGVAAGLHELTREQPAAALPIGDWRVADHLVAAARQAGAGVVLTGGDVAELAADLRRRWGPVRAACVPSGADPAAGRDSGRHSGPDAAGAAMAAALAVAAGLGRAAEAQGATLALMPDTHVSDLDLRAAHARHARRAAKVTRIEAHRGGSAVAWLVDAAWLAGRGGAAAASYAILEAEAADAGRFDICALGSDIAGAALPIGDLDSFRDSALRLSVPGDPPLRLPDGAAPPWPATAAAGPGPGVAREIRAGGLLLRAAGRPGPQSGRWTLLDESVVMAGARVMDGARLTRTIVAPGAVVHRGITVGENAAEERRWFRVTPSGTTLVTREMLLARAEALHPPPFPSGAPVRTRPGRRPVRG